MTRATLVVVAVALVVSLVAACSGGQSGGGDVLPAAPLPADQDPGLAHVHGLGVNPADDQVYAATHFGLWRLAEDGDARRVGDVAHDFMGFTVVGPDHFVASGHPVMTDDRPALLGLIETTDGGATWRSVSLLGEADFHALRAAHDAVWGWSSSDGGVYVSRDREAWERRATLDSLLDLVLDPGDQEHLVAATASSPEDARLEQSSDGGRTWEPLDGPALARLAWTQSDRLWGAGLDGRLWRSTDSGATWTDAGELPGSPEAFADADGRLLLAAGGGVIYQSVDDGQSWDELYRGGGA